MQVRVLYGDGGFKAFDVSSGELRATTPNMGIGPGVGADFSIDADGKFLCTAHLSGGRNSTRVVDLTSGAVLFTDLCPINSMSYACRFSPGHGYARRFVVGASSTWVFDAGSLPAKAPALAATIPRGATLVAWSPNGSAVALVSAAHPYAPWADGRASVWDVSGVEPKLLCELAGSERKGFLGAARLAWAPSGAHLLLAFGNIEMGFLKGSVQAFSAATGARAARFAPPSGIPLTCALAVRPAAHDAASTDIVMGAYDGTVLALRFVPERGGGDAAAPEEEEQLYVD